MNEWRVAPLGRTKSGFCQAVFDTVSENGALVFLDSAQELLPRITVTADDAGYIENFPGMPKGVFNKDLYYQYVWEDNCIDGQWSASDVIKVPRFNQPGG